MPVGFAAGISWFARRESDAWHRHLWASAVKTVLLEFLHVPKVELGEIGHGRAGMRLVFPANNPANLGFNIITDAVGGHKNSPKELRGFRANDSGAHSRKSPPDAISFSASFHRCFRLVSSASPIVHDDPPSPRPHLVKGPLRPTVEHRPLLLPGQAVLRGCHP